MLWTLIEPSWQQKKTFRRRLFIEEVGEMMVRPHIGQRKRLLHSSAAAEVVKDLQCAAAGPSPMKDEVKSRKLCDFCTDGKRKVGTTCCKCGKFLCKRHNVPICSPCSTWAGLLLTQTHTSAHMHSHTHTLSLSLCVNSSFVVPVHTSSKSPTPAVCLPHKLETIHLVLVLFLSCRCLTELQQRHLIQTEIT